MSFSIRLYLSLAGIIILTLIIYIQGVHGPYLRDDITNLLDNDSLVIKEFSWQAVKEAAFGNQVTQFRRPISMLSFAANYTYSGSKDVYSVKLTNIIIHLIIGIGIYLLSFELLVLLPGHATNNNQKQLIALISATFWLLHPFNVSTVLYVVQRMAMLSTLFVVYGCLAYVKLRQLSYNDYKFLPYLPLVTILFTFLAFFSKENGALLPGFLLLIEFFCFGFIFQDRAPKWLTLSTILLLVLPVLFILAYLGNSFITTINHDISRYFFTVYERLITQSRVLWHYIGWLFLINLEPMSIIHDDIVISKNLINPITTLFSIAAWLIIVSVCLVRLKTKHLFIFSVLWFLWGHILESSVIPLALVFEHRNYLPSIGPVIGFTCLFVNFVHMSIKRSTLRYLLIGLLFILLPSYLLTERVQNWQDHKTLYLSLLKKQPLSPGLQIEIAGFLSSSGEIVHAIEATNNAQILNPMEPGYKYAEASILCFHDKTVPFDAELQLKLTRTLNEKNFTSYYIHQYRKFSENCGLSQTNHEFLLKLHNEQTRSKSWKIAATAYYGIGLVHYANRHYQETVKAWEQSLKVGPNWLRLEPEIKRLNKLIP